MSSHRSSIRRPARRKTGPDPGPRYFATCPKGLEAALADELLELGLQEVVAGNAGVAFGGGWAACHRANLHSRIASRVLWCLGQGRYDHEDDVYELAQSLPWPDWFSVDRTIRVHVSAIASPLKSLEFITLRIKDAVCDRFRAQVGSRPSVSTVEPDMRIHAFLTANEVTLYLDTSGEPLFKRGWRRRSIEAPLRENLAAGILRLTGWQPEEPLLDPMCGSGTFIVEAAQIALGVAPGAGRHFAFERFEHHDAPAWEAARDAATASRLPVRELAIFGSDTDRSALTAAKDNLREAGVGGAARIQFADVLSLAPPAETGVLVANPPYGVRMGDSDELAAFYPLLGNALKRGFAGWRAFLFSGDTRLPKLIGLKPQRRTPLFNGAIECRLLEYRIVSGAMRRPVGDEVV